MLQARHEQIERHIRDAGGSPVGIQYGGPRQIYIFMYRDISMAMYADEMDYYSVLDHIKEVKLRY
jgi:hypothetical protein